MRFYRQLESAFVQNAMLPANTSYAKNINFIWVYNDILRISMQENSGPAYLKNIIGLHTNINCPNT